MNTFFRFFYEFTSIFFEGIGDIFKGFKDGILHIASLGDYSKVINSYKDSFNAGEWIFVWISIIILLLLVGLVIFLIVRKIKNKVTKNYNSMNKEELVEETPKPFPCPVPVPLETVIVYVPAPLLTELQVIETLGVPVSLPVGEI